MSAPYSKIKVGRASGYPVVVTQGKSEHEAILRGCGDDENVEAHLADNIDGNVKIRWKTAGYDDSVPTKSVRLQNLGGAAHPVLGRRAVALSNLPADATKKADASDEGRNPEAVTSSVAVKSEDAAYGEDTYDEDSRKPAAVTSGVAVKSEDSAYGEDTDDEDNRKPAAVTSGVEVKSEEKAFNDDTDDEDNRKPAGESDQIDKRKNSYSSELEAKKKRMENVVEFKFCSKDFSVTKGYEWKGTLHVPMLQDPASGLYRLPLGKTKFIGSMKRNGVPTSDEFEGSFSLVDGREHGPEFEGVIISGFDLGMDMASRFNGEDERRVCICTLCH